MIVDCVSDLHGFYPTLEGGDLLIVAGDLTARDTPQELKIFLDWISDQKYDRKIFIGGNHDNQLKDWISTEQSEFLMCQDEMTEYEYLVDSGTEFEGLKIWGSPWTKTFEGMNPNCKAFTCDTEEELAEKWTLIPDDTDILITHGPSWGMLDRICDKRVGSTSLLQRIVQKPLFQSLKLHVHGHIHESYGKYDIRKCQKELGDTPTCIYVNASIVNERYQHVNKPVRIIL